jgi:hypothetical protein
LASQTLKKKNNEKISVKVKLEQELEKLKEKTGFGCELSVAWLPDQDPKLSGEVKSNTIYVYERDEEKALETLRHEFIDYVVSQAIEPYRSVANRLIQFLNEEAYRRKERVVEALVKLISAPNP